MSQGDFIFSVFIDYDNLLENHKATGIIDVVTRALMQVPIDTDSSRAKCDVRIYGGWYEGPQLTRRAQDIAIQIQNDFPKIIRLQKFSGGVMPVSAYAELAVSLMQEPGHHIFDTFRRKGKPANVRVEKPENVGCNDPQCVLPMMKKLLNKGKCPKNGCGVTSTNLVYRDEQKIVDTMLACDLIFAAASEVDQVILISGDDDFLPPLRTVLLRGGNVIRLHPRENFRPAPFPKIGPRLIERSL